MAKQDKLLELVHSMSMSEKRYFKLFSQRHVTHSRTNYERLFELACDLEEPDPQVFDQKVKEAGLSLRYLSAEKYYLYQLVLRALSNFHSGRSVSLQVKEWLHQIEILFDKGLYDQCLALTHKTRQLAEKNDLYALLMEISLWERKVLAETEEVSAIKESHSQVLNHLALMDNMHAFMLLYYQLLEMEQALENETREQRRELLEPYIRHPFLQSQQVPLSFQAQRHYWMIFARYYRLMQMPKEELEANEQLLRIMNASQMYKEASPYDYLEVYNRILNLTLYHQPENFESRLQAVREFPRTLAKVPRNVQARVALDSGLFEVPWLLGLGRLDEAEEVLETLQADAVSYRQQLTPMQMLELIFWRGRCALQQGDPARTIQVVNELINDFNPEEHTFLHVYGRLLAVMAHYQRQNYPTIPYFCDAILRLLVQQKHRFGLEIWIVRQLRRLAKVEFRGQAYARLIFRGILSEWEEKIAAHPESRLPEYLDLPAWVRIVS